MLRLVLAAKRYDFTDEKTGKHIQGAKVTYLEGVESNQNVRGALPVTVGAAIEVFTHFKVLPGIYKLDFSMFPNGQGQPIIKIQSAEFSKVADLGILGAASVPF